MIAVFHALIRHVEKNTGRLRPESENACFQFSSPFMKNPKQIALVLGVALSVTLTGCATMVHGGGSRTASVATQPSGAKATISKADSGAVVSINTTPFTISLNPKASFFNGQDYRIKLELPGYQPAEVMMRAKTSGWWWSNVFLGYKIGTIGALIVDPATGAMWNLAPEKIDQPLTAVQASLLKSGNGFVVVLVPQTTAREKTAMVRTN
jgi:hypothetical protein